MEVVFDSIIEVAKKQGRQASATVRGKRCAGYLYGNRFIFEHSDSDCWYEAGPGEFTDLKIWRK